MSAHRKDRLLSALLAFLVGEKQKLLTALNPSYGQESGNPDSLGEKMECLAEGKTRGWLSLRCTYSNYWGTLRSRGLIGHG